MHRKRLGKRIELTERDIEIFKLLQRYRYLRTTFIHAFVGGDYTRLSKRLGNLFHEGYLWRPRQQWQFINARYTPAIYELDHKSEQLLRDLGLQDNNVSDLVRRGRMGANRQFAHAMMICDTLSSIELGLTRNVRFITWQEILERAPQQTKNAPNPFAIPVSISYTFPRTKKTHRAQIKLVPDGLFGLEYTEHGKSSYRFFALEAERKNRVNCSNLHQTSWLKKVLAYREITANKIYKSHFGLPNLMVMAVTPTQARIETMKTLIMDITKKGSNMFLFRHISVLGYDFHAPQPMPDLFTLPWQRAGREDFQINKAD